MRIISRAEWSARPPKSKVLIQPTPRSWIHHTAGAHPNKEHFDREGQPSVAARLFKAAAIQHVQGIQNFHMNQRGWSDIGYSFVIFKAWFGRNWVFEGRGWKVQGAHTAGDNSSSHGFSVVGNYEVEKINKRTLNTIRKLIDLGHEKGHLSGDRAKHPTGGHREAPGASTACPGKNLLAHLGELRKPAEDAKPTFKLVVTKVFNNPKYARKIRDELKKKGIEAEVRKR